MQAPKRRLGWPPGRDERLQLRLDRTGDMITKNDLLEREVDVCERLRSQLLHLRRQPARRRNPIITLTYAQSIDGCIAPLEGGPLQLSNAQTQRLTHRIRAFHDAILVGINTVLCDNPRLTVRLSKGQHPQPIVLDSRLRIPPDANLLSHPCLPPLIATGPAACDAKARRLEANGARVIRTPLGDDGLIDLSVLLPRLKQLGLHSVMVEGGAEVITNMLSARIPDQLLLAISPRFVGGLRAVNPIDSPQPMPRLREVQYQSMAGDLVVWGRFDSAPDGSNDAAVSIANSRPQTS